MPVPGSGPNIPTAAQLAQLATLQATESAALVTYKAALASVASAHSAFNKASIATSLYQAYIYGAATKAGVVDEGGQGVT